MSSPWPAALPQPLQPGDRVLDAACGLGYGSHLIRNVSAAAEVLGIDDSVIPFSRTRRFIRKHLSAAQVYELETGHNMLSDKAIRKFAEYWEAKTKKRHKAALEE